MKKFNNLQGKIFGKLTVTKYYGKKNGQNEWECECDCGNTIVVRAAKLLSEGRRSCGKCDTSKNCNKYNFEYQKLENSIRVW